MAKRIAKFHKVSFEQFQEGWTDTFGPEDKSRIQEIYDGIRLPARATKGSAGYDFFAPAAFTLKPGETVKIPTGIRVEMEEEWVLKCYPRSGLGFKYRLQLNNTVGIIVEIPAGTGFMQGIFVEYGITVDDQAEGIRNGGFGSTN